MPPKLRQAYIDEFSQARSAYALQDLDTAFYHLERAHILGQRYFAPHLETHYWMWKIGIQRKDFREIFGQILRIIAVFPAAVLGWVPIGNTGGANVSALKPMAIPQDLKKYFEM